MVKTYWVDLYSRIFQESKDYICVTILLIYYFVKQF